MARFSEKVGTLGALNAALSMDVSPFTGVRVMVAGTMTGTVIFEKSTDGGSTWATVPAGIVKRMSDGTFVTSNAFTGAHSESYRINTAGFTNLRARVSVYTSGSTNAVGVALLSSRNSRGANERMR